MEYKRKFSVFISSTYEDLKEERQTAMQVALENDLIPVGMEQFHAAPIKQWDMITKMIDDCDFYLLIIGGRYGSLVENGQISYTEKEYNYAKENGIPVYAFIKNIETITKEEMDREDYLKKQKRLDEFREKVEMGENLVDFFKSLEELKYVLSASLSKAKEHAQDEAGWIRWSEVQHMLHEQIEHESQKKENKWSVQSKAVENIQNALETFADSLEAMKDDLKDKRTVRVEGETLYIE